MAAQADPARPFHKCEKSERTAAAGVPAEAIGAHARTHNDDRRGDHDRARGHDDWTAHRTAAAIGAAVPARAATTGGAGRLAEADDCAGKHHSGEQIVHLTFLLVLGGKFLR